MSVFYFFLAILCIKMRIICGMLIGSNTMKHYLQSDAPLHIASVFMKSRGKQL